MKKRIFACILVLLMLGLVLYVGLKQEHGSVDVMSGSIAQQQDRPKIALTFDDDVIIGLSQEISYKEAVSMI